MRLAGKVVVVTGAAGGIGAALAHRFATEGAAAVMVSDLSEARAAETAAAVRSAGGRAEAMTCDVSDETAVRALVAATETAFGPIDLFCSNAGVASGVGLEGSDADWSRSWSVNVMAHVYAARAVVPSMLARGGGYLLNTCSAAGLLTAAGDAPYTATKHAAVGFAEWLSVMYGDAGLRVSALCPQGVRTAMMHDGLAAGNDAARLVEASAAMLGTDEVADAVIEGLASERFLILPHAEVATFQRHKAADPDRWLAGMRRFVAATLRRGNV